MEKLYFSDLENFCSFILDVYEDNLNEDFDLDIVVHYDFAKDIISTLSQYYDMCYVGIEKPDFDGYNREYIISLNADGLWCTPAFRDDHYIHDEPQMLFIHEDCNSALLKTIKCEDSYEICFAEEVEFDGDCEKCPFADLEDGVLDEEDFEIDDDLHGFTLSTTDDGSYKYISFYSTEKIDDIGVVKELIKLFGM